MAPSPERKELREINMRLKLKNEEMKRLKDEIKTLKERRSALQSSLSEQAPETETAE